MAWNSENGVWQTPTQLWNVESDIPENAPENWLSKAGGDYYIGMSFHISPFTIIDGDGVLPPNLKYQPSDFYLSRTHDPYNSWGVNAIKRKFLKTDPMNFWSWLPGITVYDRNTKYSLPAEDLSAYAGTEWADNDARVFHGLHDDELRDKLITKYIQAINDITGPRFSGWPFGQRQLKDAAFIWIHHQSKEIHRILLASSIQSGDKFSYFNKNLYDPGDQLGSWANAPSSWDCRQPLRSLYKSKLLSADGFHEIALVAAISAVETAFFEIVLYLEGGDVQGAKSKITSHTFRNRAKILISSYGYTLPNSIYTDLTKAYKVRNSIAHELANQTQENISDHIKNLENVIIWYYNI
ncbi:hypothetical protein [Pseudomonas sp. NFX15]|uniref:hypothetical protein n=1 Tax=Pseudomonas sp. NFX15 TaxID=2816958 RepID=UPI003B8B651C